MTLIVEQRQLTYSKDTGSLLKLGHTPKEALEFFKSLTEGQEGWIETSYGYSPHIRGHKDGKGAVLTDARISPDDYQVFVTLLGLDAANLITRYHNIY